MKISGLKIPEEYLKIPLPFEGSFIGRVVAKHRRYYSIQSEQGILSATSSGRLQFLAESDVDLPGVGDWVLLSPADASRAMIESILPRKSSLVRRFSGRKDTGQLIAANLDAAFIVMSGGRDFSLNRLERYLAIVYEGGIKPYIVLNKIDLYDRDSRNTYREAIRQRHPDLPLLFLSAISGEGMIEIIKSLQPGNTYCFLGSSGVGKTTLIQLLSGKEDLRTVPISEARQKGVHTTTFRELIELSNGTYLIDTPGLRELGLSAADAGIEQTFADIITFAEKCRFRDCSHLNEPGCAVQEAVSQGWLSPDKLENYLRLKEESKHFQMEDYQRRRQKKQLAIIRREYKEMQKK